ncbi:hypothetical protein M9X92_011787 [Pyricularia oryzae]|nr:hypothetical protein M9X92_011787 [Pyricularia oryzae]
MNSFSFSMILNLPSSPACIRDDEVPFFTAELFTFSAPLLLPPHNWRHKKVQLQLFGCTIIAKISLLALITICKVSRSSCKCALAVWLQIHYNSVSGSANYLTRLVVDRFFINLVCSSYKH